VTSEEARQAAHALLGPSVCKRDGTAAGIVYRCTALCKRLQANELRHALDVEALRREGLAFEKERDEARETSRRWVTLAPMAHSSSCLCMWCEERSMFSWRLPL
jgi:hypothetical protein